jgi:hypothetical protein
MTKKKKNHGFPMVIYVRKDQDDNVEWYSADPQPGVLLVQDDKNIMLGRYTLSDTVEASLEVKFE